MLRAIIGYRKDEAGDWVAVLECEHGQHVRHKPPFFSRPWVETDEGRTSKLGTSLDCVRCDRLELPEGLVAHRRTAEFDQGSIPAGLLRDHTTRRGVWGVIHVLSGRLRYIVEGLDGRDLELDPHTPGIVAPEVAHRVSPVGAVRFYVEFLKREAPGG